MSDILETCAFTTIDKQCESLEKIGFDIKILIHDAPTLRPLHVRIRSRNKTYYFSDPDLNIIIAQLATLYKTYRNDASIKD